MVESGQGEHAEKLYFEDHISGSQYELGSIPVDEKEMIDFAEHYDPQPFHIDPKAAGKTAFRGLIASGWFTVVLAMRLLVERHLSRMANLGSPGVDELRWFMPVRPGDVLSVRLTILDARRSRSKPDRGIVQGFVEVLNENGEIVASWKGVNIVLCRNAEST